MNAVVITPTTGIFELAKAMDSTEGQPCEHWLVIDGAMHAEKAAELIWAKQYTNKKIILLPENTGKPTNHWSKQEDLIYYGHRVYAAMAHLVNADHVLFLDEDNWYEPNHVETMLQMMNIPGRNHEWCYSLRKCVKWDGEFLCNDDCDSLGIFASWKNISFVDMNCYCFKTDFLLKISQNLESPNYNTDRKLYRHAVAASRDYDSYACTGLYTVNYRVKPHIENFFLEGNEHMNRIYNGNFPWRAK